MDFKWTGTIDLSALINLAGLPLLVMIWRGVVFLVVQVKWCAKQIQEIKEWQVEQEAIIKSAHANEIRLAKIETILEYIIPDTVTDLKIAQIFKDSLKKPVDKEKAAAAGKKPYGHLA